MRKLLFIGRHFPPVGGAGVQRSLKFVKHLPNFGWLPVVVTSAGAGSNRWTPADQSMLAEVPDFVPIFRADCEAVSTGPEARTRARSALLEAGRQALQAHSVEAIFVSMSPFEDAAVAEQLSREAGVPWIADLRDPWALDEFQVYRTRWHRRIELRRMAQALASAASIIMNTPEAMARFRNAFPELADKARVNITNGYDADDFQDSVESIRPGKFAIVHAGYFHAGLGLRQRRRALEYRLLGRIEPGIDLLPRSHYFLIQALERLRREAPATAENIRVICVGSATPVDRRLVEQSRVADLFEFTGFLSHHDSLRYVRGADLLFLPMHRLPPGRRATIVPGKTYEYLASGRPILAAVPAGDAQDFLRRSGAGEICPPDGVSEILDALRRRHTAWRRGENTMQPNHDYVQRFERRNLTQQLAAHLDSLLNVPRVDQRMAGTH